MSRFRRKSPEDPSAARAGEDAPTAVIAEELPPPPQPAAGLDLPAGTDLDALVGSAPGTRRRSRLRRRLRHLRSVREVLLRDLGGLVFEARRKARDQDPAVRTLVESKLTRLDAVDAELRELEATLDDKRGLVVREPGIGGTCPTCGELHGSDARFCWACGTPVAPGAQRPAAPAVPAAAPPPPPPPAP